MLLHLFHLGFWFGLPLKSFVYKQCHLVDTRVHCQIKMSDKSSKELPFLHYLSGCVSFLEEWLSACRFYRTNFGKVIYKVSRIV